MERVQLLLLGLPILLFCTDLLNLFSAPPPQKPSAAAHHHHHHHVPPPPPTNHHHHPDHQQTLDLPSKASVNGVIGAGAVININFCSSCSYRGTAMTMKKMLETSFPGVDVILANYPPSFPKRVLSKMIPVFQIGVMGIVMAGEHIFPRLGFIAPPPWYFSMRQNRFGTIATTWLLGNMLQSFLQSSGAFEVFCNGELVFSKLKEQRFPSEFELRELIGKSLGNSRVMDGVGAVMW
ncbi:hypothetical protein Sjap_014127 [Stephania japonica]|uniref:SelT-like protein n=1 Tax=Stephania japonica TaxID=461633 RepID=A0AAP0P0N1_9MAGN